MENDLFDDLFGNEGFLTPKSMGSDRDSGHGSPFESPFDDVSPTPSFAWEGADRGGGDLWGSILDDLASDITDDSDSNGGDLRQADHDQILSGVAPVSCNDALAWSTDVLDNGETFVDNPLNFVDQWNLHGNVFDDIKPEQLGANMLPSVHMNNLNLVTNNNNNNMNLVTKNNNNTATPTLPLATIALPEIADVPTPESLPSENDDQLTNNNVSVYGNEAPLVEIPSTPPPDKIPSTPVVVKPVTAVKAPTWVLANSTDIKSHFQLTNGQNIIAIIQNINGNGINDNNNGNGINDNNNGNGMNVIEEAREEPIDVETISSPLEVDIGSPDDGIGSPATDFGSPDSTDFTGYHRSSSSPMIHHSDHDYADIDMSSYHGNGGGGCHGNGGTSGVSVGVGPGLVLTDEEKKLLEVEGTNIPEDAPLTKEEEKILKKVRRKIKNKQSAMESRRKRKEYIDNLERRVKHCTDMNNGLRKKVDKLSKENKSLVSQLKAMKEFIGSFQDSRAPSKGTCLAVLVLSFALFVVPFGNPLHYFDGKAETGQQQPDPTPMWRSRTLLDVDDNTEYYYQEESHHVNASLPAFMMQGKGFYEPNDENLKIQFESVDENLKLQFERGGVKWNTSSSTLMYQNFTWYSTVSHAERHDNNNDNNNYVTF